MGCVNIVVAGPETVTPDYISLVTQSKLTCMQKQEIKFDVSPFPVLGNQVSLMCVHPVNVTYMKRCAYMYLANDIHHWQ